MSGTCSLLMNHKTDHQPFSIHKYDFLVFPETAPARVSYDFLHLAESVPEKESPLTEEEREAEEVQAASETAEENSLPAEEEKEETKAAEEIPGKEEMNTAEENLPGIILAVKEEKTSEDWTRYTPIQKKLFDSLEAGDIIFAWMPLPEEQLAKVRENHQKRPYVIVSKGHGSLKAFPCTSQSRYTDPAARYELGEVKYKLWKCGWVRIEKPVFLPIGCLISKVDRLRDDDIAAINTIARKQEVKQIERTYSFRVENGDIIRDRNRLYYVYAGKNGIMKYYLLNRQGKKKAFTLKTDAGILYPEFRPTSLTGVIDKSCVVCRCTARIRNIMETRIRKNGKAA